MFVAASNAGPLVTLQIIIMFALIIGLIWYFMRVSGKAIDQLTANKCEDADVDRFYASEGFKRYTGYWNRRKLINLGLLTLGYFWAEMTMINLLRAVATEKAALVVGGIILALGVVHLFAYYMQLNSSIFQVIATGTVAYTKVSQSFGGGLTITVQLADGTTVDALPPSYARGEAANVEHLEAGDQAFLVCMPNGTIVALADR